MPRHRGIDHRGDDGDGTRSRAGPGAGARILLGEVEPDGEALLRRARREGWEGVIAKRLQARYEPGRRSRSWLKVKVENRQEFVVGGYTEPRGARRHFGALLVGWYDEGGTLRFAGHVGTGFGEEALASMHRRLVRLERKTSPFTPAPETNRPAHWVTPRTVVEVRFNEWTEDGGLRHPVFLGVREDKDPREVRREPTAVESGARGAGGVAPDASTPAPAPGAGPTAFPDAAAIEEILGRIEALERGRGRGTLELPSTGRQATGAPLDVTNLNKVFFPDEGYTKGDLMRYYVQVSPWILPAMADRPLVLRRFPHGISGESFYQQNAGDSVPDGVRVEVLRGDDGEEQRRFVGGDLTTLLHLVQLGAISVDPWHARFPDLEWADYAVLDLDPGEHTSFGRVVEVAGLVREELDAAGLRGALKTSGATGLHIFVPMPPETPNDAAQLVARIVAERVAARAPRIATTERMVRSRPRGTVYVDFLQNILGKTVAGVYAARARPGATASTPLAWDELGPRLDPKAHTIRTLPARIREVGDLWGPMLAGPASLEGLLQRAGAE